MVPRPIFVHGAGGGSSTWHQQEPRFEGCVALSLPGHPGGSPFASVGAYTEWAAHALREIQGPRVIVGHSMGGAVALQLALDHPELVDGLVLIATGAQLFVPDAAFELARTDHPAECERLLRKGWPAADDETIAEEVAAMVEAGQQTLLADYAACRSFDVIDRLGEVGVPALVIVGDDDALTPPSLAHALADGLRQAIVVLVPGAGHWVMKERSATVDLLLAGFLARLELSGD